MGQLRIWLEPFEERSFGCVNFERVSYSHVAIMLWTSGALAVSDPVRDPGGTVCSVRNPVSTLHGDQKCTGGKEKDRQGILPVGYTISTPVSVERWQGKEIFSGSGAKTGRVVNRHPELCRYLELLYSGYKCLCQGRGVVRVAILTLPRVDLCQTCKVEILGSFK